ncbi:MAG TPA: hypothetical protein VJA21_30780 [Verrucomicrobiae bacterium]
MKNLQIFMLQTGLVEILGLTPIPDYACHPPAIKGKQRAFAMDRLCEVSRGKGGR